MSRKADVDWNLPDKLETWEQVNTAVLMDIRDELRRIRTVLECQNVRAAAVAVQRMDRRLAKRMKLR